MAFQQVPDTAQFVFRFNMSLQLKVVTFSLYARDTVNAWTAARLEVIGDLLAAAIVSEYMPLVSSDHQFLGYKSRSLDTEFGDSYEEDQPAPVAGSVVSPSLPANIAPCVTFVGSSGSAPRRGRVFLLPPTEGQCVGQLLDAAVAANLATAFEDINNSIAPPNDLNAAQVIVSRFSGTSLQPGPRPGETTFQPNARATGVTNTIQAVRVNRRVDTQRRRLNVA